MRSGNLFASVNLAVASAIARDLPDVREHTGDDPASVRVSRPNEKDVEVRVFLQTWPSTSPGFPGIGGQAMTQAYTTVVMHNGNAAVYFGDKYAYTVKDYNRIFTHDLDSRRMASYKESNKYESLKAID